MSLYFWLDILSISVPLLVSFHPRIALYKHWKSLFVAIFIAMIPYIIWDIYFTREGYWGFNQAYLSNIYVLDLPLEEWLFFICIPYACVFTQVSILRINPNLGLSRRNSSIMTYILLALFLIIGIANYERAYTLVDMIFAFAVLVLAHLFLKKTMQKFYVTFLFMLIPFLVVNGVLTGSGITDQVVWYKDLENLGIRVITIPVEDFAYAFSLILLNLFLFEKLKNSQITRLNP